MLELDRILDRDDVPRVAQVHLVHQRRQRRRLSGSGGPADEHQPAGQPRQRLDRRRQMQRRETRHRRRQTANRRRGPPALAVQVDAEPADLGVAIRAVGDAAVAIHPPRVRRQRGQHGVFNLFAAERSARRRAERHDDAVDAQGRKRAGDEQQIAGRSRDDFVEPGEEARELVAGTRRSRQPRVELGDDRVEVVGIAHDTASLSAPTRALLQIELSCPSLIASPSGAVCSGTARAAKTPA